LPPRARVAPSGSGTFGHRRQALFEVAAGLVNISSGDAAHRHGRGDDHIRQFGEQVIAAAADPFARVQAMHANERLGRLAYLLGQLEQADLDGDSLWPACRPAI
jgi:hypothetical protein